MNLFLVEYDYQVEDILQRINTSSGYWIALGPSAMWALNQKGIPYQIPENFYTNEHLEELCLENHKNVEWFCNCMDEQLRIKYPDLKKWGTRPFLFHIFPLMVLFDGLVGRIFKLRTILNAHPRHTIYTHLGPHYQPFVYGLTFSNKETLWGHLLALPGWNTKIELLKELKNKNGGFNGFLQRKNITILKNIKELFEESFIGYNITRNFKLKQWDQFLSYFKTNTKGAILIHNNIYNWSETIPLLSSVGWRIIFSDDSHFGSYQQNNNIEKDLKPLFIENNKEIMDYFRYQGISFYPLLKGRISWLLENSPLLCRKIAYKIERLIKKYKIKAILTTANVTGISNAINQAGKYFGIPVFSWQHGAIVPYNNNLMQFYEFALLMTCDVAFIYGENIKRNFEVYQNKFSTNAVTVGSSRLDRMKSINNKLSKKQVMNNVKSINILYAATNYYQNLWYGGMSPPFSDCYIFQDRLSIVKSLQDIIKKNHNVNAMVKLHPYSSSQDPPWMDEFYQINNIKFINDEISFLELLLRSDIVLLDLPSTTLLEAISTNLPVFTLMRHWNYPSFARALLEKRAVCADNVETLTNYLCKYLDSGFYPADTNDDSFLRGYGNFLNDGKSAERAVNEILKIIESKTQKEIIPK